MEALDNKIKENRRMKKLNLNEGLFSSLLLWKASLTIFVADFVFRKGGLYWEKSTKLSPPQVKSSDLVNPCQFPALVPSCGLGGGGKFLVVHIIHPNLTIIWTSRIVMGYT